MPKTIAALFQCMECGRRFKTTRAAERASSEGCPGCGGCDIDLELSPRMDAAHGIIRAEVQS